MTQGMSRPKNEHDRIGRREQNKQDKLARITSAARELFAQKGIHEVTTQEISQRANVATGTLFLYAKTKGELLLLAQNSNYQQAHIDGLKSSANEPDFLKATLNLLTPIIECNREHVENGRTYLQEVVFGIGQDIHRETALALMQGTESEVQNILMRTLGQTEAEAKNTAQVVMAVLFLTLSSPRNEALSVAQLTREVRIQLQVLASR